MTNEELDSVMTKAKELFKKGKPLFGKNGAFHFMLEEFLNKALDAEMDEHIAENKGNGGKDRRNGKMRKTVQSEYGPVEIETPRDIISILKKAPVYLRAHQTTRTFL